ncbi:MAG: gamma-glutamylcyclotransferase family protein [Mangrovicoccus sp.]
MTSRLFVYGTLRAACPRGPVAAKLHQVARHLGAARYQGRLYRVVWYPGIVPSTDPRDQVLGDLYELPEDPALWAELDAYEGIAPGKPEPQEYSRDLTQVQLADGGHSAAWIYRYQWPLDEALRIDSGDWCAAIPK